MEDGQQQVLFVYFSGSLDSGLQHGQFQDVTCFLVEYEVGGMDWLAYLVLPHPLLQLGLDRLHVQVQ